MNSRHRRTLEAIFSEPVPRTLEWSRLEALLVALGATVVEGQGSRIAFVLEGRKALLHRPHPGKEAKGYQVVYVREFLEKIGVTP